MAESEEDRIARQTADLRDTLTWWFRMSGSILWRSSRPLCKLPGARMAENLTMLEIVSPWGSLRISNPFIELHL